MENLVAENMFNPSVIGFVNAIPSLDGKKLYTKACNYYENRRLNGDYFDCFFPHSLELYGKLLKEHIISSKRDFGSYLEAFSKKHFGRITETGFDAAKHNRDNVTPAYIEYLQTGMICE